MPKQTGCSKLKNEIIEAFRKTGLFEDPEKVYLEAEISIKQDEIDMLKKELEEERRKHAATLWKYCDHIDPEEYRTLQASFADLENVHQLDRIRINHLNVALDIMTEKYQKLKEFRR